MQKPPPPYDHAPTSTPYCRIVETFVDDTSADVWFEVQELDKYTENWHTCYIPPELWSTFGFKFYKSATPAIFCVLTTAKSFATRFVELKKKAEVIAKKRESIKFSDPIYFN